MDITTRVYLAMLAVLLLSFLVIGSLVGFWPALGYIALLILACRGYWLLVVARPRLVCVRLKWLYGSYEYWEVA